MPRYEITGTATDHFGIEIVQHALREAGAERVSRRNAFGWRNQPHVATFAAVNQAEADRICEIAREELGSGSFPALLPYPYRA